MLLESFEVGNVFLHFGLQSGTGRCFRLFSGLFEYEFRQEFGLYRVLGIPRYVAVVAVLQRLVLAEVGCLPQTIVRLTVVTVFILCNYGLPLFSIRHLVFVVSEVLTLQ